MRVLISSCICGDNCKYNGGSNYNEQVTKMLKKHDIIKICPEMLYGMPTPRKSAELVNGVVMDIDGKNVDYEYRAAVELAMQEIQYKDIDLVILQSRSPTCGVDFIYDGSFSGQLKRGKGLFAQALIEAGYTVVDVENFEKLRDILNPGHK